MLISSIDQWKGLLHEIEKRKVVSLDLETTGLSPCEGDQLCMVILYHPDLGSNVACFRMHGLAPNLPVECIRDLQPIVDKCELVGHNIGPFDLNFLRMEGLNISKARVWDTLLGALLWDDSLPRYGLKPLAVTLLGGGSHDIIQGAERLWKWQAKAKTKDASQIPMELALPYAEDDGELAWRLREFLEPKILERGDPYPRLLAQDMKWSLFLGELGWNGMALDEDRAERLLQISRQKAYEIEKGFRDTWNPSMKVGSPAQVGRMFTGRYGYTLPNTEDWVMRMAAKERFELNNDVEAVLEYRRWAKMGDTWLKPWLQSFRRGNGRVRSHWGIDASNEAKRASGFTRTLRLRSSKPNLQAVPVDDPYYLRSMFLAEEDDSVLVGYDESQIEVRLAAHYARDERMLEELRRPEGDVHQMVATDLRVPRYRAKRLSLGAIYRIGGAHLAEELTKETLVLVREEQARTWLRNYNARYPGFGRAARQAETAIQQRGHLRLWNGRRVHFNAERDEPHKAFNLLIQTGVSELIKEAILRMLDFFRAEGLRQKIILQVHDEIIVETPLEEVEYKNDFIRLLTSIGPEGGWRCPLVVEPWQRRRWSDKLPQEVA